MAVLVSTIYSHSPAQAQEMCVEQMMPQKMHWL